MVGDRVSKEAIKAWLTEFQSGERMFKEYFVKHQKLIRMEMLYDKNKDAKDVSERVYVYTDLEYIHSNLRRAQGRHKFEEKIWFSSFWDISLHKHPRYYPEFVHEHKFFEMCFVLSGECQQCVQVSGEQEYVILRKGDIMVLPPGLKHSVRMAGDGIVVNILIRRSTFEEIFLHNIPSETLLFEYFAKVLYMDHVDIYLKFSTEGDERFLEMFYEMAYEYCNRRYTKATGRIVNLQLSIFFARILQDYYESIEILGNVYGATVKIPAILQYMEINYANMTIKKLAEDFNFSESYVRKVFKKSTGKTLLETLQGIRLAKARELLEKTEISVENVAHLIGYEDTTHFIRLFKKYFGLPPAKYRKGCTEKAD